MGPLGIADLKHQKRARATLTYLSGDYGARDMPIGFLISKPTQLRAPIFHGNKLTAVSGDNFTDRISGVPLLAKVEPPKRLTFLAPLYIPHTTNIGPPMVVFRTSVPQERTKNAIKNRFAKKS